MGFKARKQVVAQLNKDPGPIADAEMSTGGEVEVCSLCHGSIFEGEEFTVQGDVVLCRSCRMGMN